MGMVFEGNQIAVGEYKMFTMPATAKTCEIQNLSHLALNISSNIQGTILILQPYESIPIDVQGNEQITFTLQTPILTANSQTGEYVQYKTSSVAYSGGITALALIPVYTTDVTVKSGSVDISGGTVTANIPAGTAVDISGPVTVGSITETVNTAGTATIDNTFVPNNTLVNFGQYIINVSNLASGAQVGTNGILNPEQWGYFDGVFVLWSSANNYTYNGHSAYGWNNFGNAGVALVTNIVTPINQNVVYFQSPQAFSRIGVNLTNGESTAIASDTLTISVYALRASETINNPTSNPVQQQMAQTFNGNSLAGFFNTDGSQGTNTGTPCGLIPANSTNVTYFWLFYRNTGTSTQNILLSSAQSGGLNLFEDNIPAGGTLTIEWRMEGGGNLDAVWCTYSLASAGIINFMSNALEYPQNITPTTVK